MCADKYKQKVNTSRVAFFSDSLAERNGTGAYYFDLLESLKKELPNIEIFQPLRDVRFSRLSIPMPGDPSQRLITPNLFRIRNGLKKLKPKTIVIVTPGPFGIVGYLYAKKHKLNCITAFHTDFEQLTKIYWNPLSRFFANLYLKFINRCLCRNSQYTLINNSKLISDIQKLGCVDYKLMGTPLPKCFLDSSPQPLPPQIKQICFAGRLALEKNIDLIINSAKDFPSIRFIIIGEGPLRSVLMKKAKPLKNVKFMNWLNRRELVNIIDLSNALLLPSKIETFGSIAYESMARGRPVIVSINSGINEWENLSKHILKMETFSDLSRCIQSLIDMTESERAKLSQNSFIAARDFHNESIKQWINLLTHNL